MAKTSKTSLAGLKLGVIGFGKMSEAILSCSLQKKTIRPQQILNLKHRAKRDADLKRRYKIQLAPDIATLCKNSNVILLGVKPQQMGDVLATLRPHLKNHLVITLAAGLSARFYQKCLGANLRLIRAMPNTPTQLGLGATAYFATKTVASKDKALCETFFAATGLIEEVKSEKLIDAVIAVSGSGPAFIYRYAANMIASGKKLGLSFEQAKRLALQTLLGATEMMRQTDATPDELIAQVASKKGTTLAGLDVLEKNGFDRLIQACLARTAARSAEISKEREKELCRS
jgi:pyrroline-5-carboxylate reductase